LKASKRDTEATEMVLSLYGARYDRQFLSRGEEVDRDNAEVRRLTKTNA